ncbi:acetyltransferase [Vibrio cholerae]|nr:acetyltransferase [Vibrio cholerae]EJL6633744.1 acetyltransferase [Vibrio cholerae]
MVAVVVFEFSGMRCQPLRRALYALGGNGEFDDRNRKINTETCRV